MFSLMTYQQVYKIAAHDSSVTSLQFDSEWLVSGGNDGKVRVWESATGRWVRDLGDGGDGVWKVGFTSNDARRRRGVVGEMGQDPGEGGVVAVMCKRGTKSVMEIWSMAPRAGEF